jgi:hypothetical protein
MLLVAWVQWWYGAGWRDAAARLLKRLRTTYLTFSVPILIPTLFAPWKRIITDSGGSINAQFRAALDNLLSRCIGAAVRLMALSAALLIMAGTAVVGGLILVAWPLLPILGPVLIVMGFVL